MISSRFRAFANSSLYVFQMLSNCILSKKTGTNDGRERGPTYRVNSSMYNFCVDMMSSNVGLSDCMTCIGFPTIVFGQITLMKMHHRASVGSHLLTETIRRRYGINPKLSSERVMVNSGLQTAIR
jgi:hypothetical protein